MRFLALAVVAVMIGVLVMIVYTFSLEYSAAKQATIDCKPTNMYAISGARKMRIYDCGDEI
jgi:hypothetical protein